MPKKPSYEELEQRIQELEQAESELKTAEKALRKCEEKHKTFIESIEDGYYEVDIAGNFTFLNDAMCKILGYSKDELSGMSNRRYMDEENAKKVFKSFNQVYKTGEPSEAFDWELIRKDGSRCYIETSVALKKDSKGQPIGFQGIARDITERKQAEEALRESEKQYRTIGETVPYGVWLADAVGYCTYVSKSFLELVDMTMEQVQAFGWLHLLPPEDVEPAKGHWLHCVETGEHFEREHRFRAKDGNYRNVLAIGRPIKDDTGKIVKWVGLNLDITERKRTEEALKKSEQELEVTLDATTDGIYKWNFKTNELIFSQRCYRMLGYEPGDFPASYDSWKNLIHPDDLESALRVADNYIETKPDHYENEFRMMTKTGEARWIRARSKVVERDERGDAVWIIGNHEDITERKEAEEALRKSQQVIEGIINTIPVRVFWKDKNLVYLGCNALFAHDAGFADPKDIIGKDDYQMVWRDQAELYRGDDRQVIESGRSKFLIEEPQTTPEGNTITLLTSKTPLRSSTGEISGVLGTYMDITERKQAEDALREKTYDLNERVKELNCLYSISGFVEKIDTSLDEVLQAIVHIIPPSFRYPEVTCARILLNGKEYKTENFKQTKWKQASGIFVYGELKGTLEVCCLDEQLETDECPFFKEERELINAIAERLSHIIERKQTEDKLRESEEKYRTLLETTSEGCWLLNHELKTIEVNNALCKMLGYRQDEMIGKTPFDFVDDENRKIFIEQTSKIPDTTHRSYEITLKKKNGQDLHICFNSTTLRDKSGAVQSSFAFVTDITQRKKAEKERNRLSVAIEQASESVFITDRHGTIQYVNPAFERLTGYSRKDAIGQNPRILKSGKQDALFYKQMWDTLARGHAWKGHFVNRKKDGSLYEADATISPLLDKLGNITNFVSIKRDVTREIELERQLIQAQKMESIGTLAGGIAHEFNNILSIIIGNAEVALDDVPDSLAKECLDEIRSASLRASALVKQILSFARKSLAEQDPIQISPIIKDSLRLLRASIPTTIEISQEISCEFDTVFANPTQISQVIMNLCTNAAQAMDEHGGVLKVILKNVEFENQDAGLNLKSGRYVKLTVSDTGHGIKPEIIDRIFDPYFTTKEIGKGTGMGLSMVHGIVKSYDGTITVTSEPGKGTVFEVLLPVIEAETEPKDKKPDILPTGTERILFVDDEQSLVKVARRILERLGYEVETKINPVKALELFRSGPDRFDLVITDMTMPQMTGKRLAKEILDIRPDMPIILCTGYHEKISEEKARELGIKAFVTKPFVTHNFALTVRKVLDEK